MRALLQKQKYTEADEVRYKALPAVPFFREWKQNMYEDTCSASGRPDECFIFLRKIEEPGVTFESLADSGEFSSLDAKIAKACANILKNDDLKRKVNQKKEEAKMMNRLLNGRQTLHMIFEWYKLVEEDGCIFDFTHLTAVRMKDNNLSKFLDDWDHTLSGMSAIPESSILESVPGAGGAPPRYGTRHELLQ